MTTSVSVVERRKKEIRTKTATREERETHLTISSMLQSMMPIIFLTFSAEAPSYRTRKKANKMFKLNSLPVFLNLTTEFVSSPLCYIISLNSSSYTVPYRQPRFQTTVALYQSLDDAFALCFVFCSLSTCLLRLSSVF